MISRTLKLLVMTAAVSVVPCGMAVPAALAQTSSIERQSWSVPKGASLPIIVPKAFGRLAVSEPDIADAAPVSTREYYVRGREVGKTNILVYAEGGPLLQIVDINVTPNIGAIKQDLTVLYPDVEIDLYSVADRIHVRGTVMDTETETGILDIVQSHAPDRVINALKVELPQQVLLEVRFVEASREDIRELGFGHEIGRPGDFLLLSSSALLSGPVEKTAGALFGGSGDVTIDVFLKALEEKGIVRTLAEPNLVARSGESASFLAGGEFPVPVAADEGQITIAFKDFGVSLDFSPTVVNEDRIVLKVTPEVSQLDLTNSVRLSDVEIPALSVRKVDTTVELGSGDSFAIAGLIQNTYDESTAQTPLLGDVPILGALFRSNRFRNNETELVVIITPYLVEGTSAPGALSDPMAGNKSSRRGDAAILSAADSDAEFGGAVAANIEVQRALRELSQGGS